MGQFPRANHLVFRGGPLRAIPHLPSVGAISWLTAAAIALSSSIFAVESTSATVMALPAEPFFVAYQDYRAFKANFSASVEIADPIARGEPTSVAGDVTLAAFRRVGKVATILEANVAFDAIEAPVRLAPGIYWRPFDVPVDVAVSLPVGLSDGAPELVVYVLAIFEFEPGGTRND